jgi:non-ribosomal peptide synthase protein (TIGR01720 family)
LQASLNLAHGPLIRVALFDLGAGQPGRLLIIIHHLAIDGVSWRILLEDLQTAYQQLDQGQPIRLPAKTGSFQQWAKLIHELVAKYGSQPQASYWLAETRRQAPELPLDFRGVDGANTEASVGLVRVSLEAAETRALLQEAPAAYHTQINDLLLTALVQAFAPWVGVSALLVDLEGHGREEIVEGVDLSRTVGWFTTIFPVYLTLEGVTQLGEAVKSVKEQLRQIPNRGIDYGLLRYLGEPAIQQQLQCMPQAEISFNYLGQFDQVLSGASWFKLASESSGPVFGPRGQRAYLIEISGSIIANHLELEWTYSQNLHHRATIETLAHRFIEALRALIAHCQSAEAGSYTPSDFPEAGLTQAELDSLLAELNE